MAHSIKRKRGKNDELVIAVVRNGSVEEMAERLPDMKSWYEYFLKSKSFLPHIYAFTRQTPPHLPLVSYSSFPVVSCLR